MIERRRHYRTTCRVSACIEQRGLVNADRYCRTSNIGMKGVFMPDVPSQPIGKVCKLLIRDHFDEDLRIDARVTHVTDGGVGFVFTNPKVEECLKLKHLVKPHWDRQDFMQAMMMVMRYSSPATDLKDCLALISLLSNNPGIFSRQPHKSCSTKLM
jgi:hypothetical protein